jgi:uncharacterized protein (TIGR03435 family)
VRRVSCARNLIALCLTATLHAQTSFDVASIKRSEPNSPNGSTFEYRTGGGLRVQNGTLGGLIESAYDVRDFQIIGGPDWVNVDRFDVLARSASDAAPASRDTDIAATRLKLRAVLADRFQLVLYRETRELPRYVLRVNRDGPKPALERASSAANTRTGIQSTCGHMMGTSASMTNLTLYLSRQLRRPVLDATGLSERYNFQLDWTPELAPCGDSAGDAPSIFTAIQEQLGLTLDASKGPVDVLVIDSAQRPAGD